MENHCILLELRMAGKYLTFISDEHLLACIANLHASYVRAKGNLSKRTFYKNKIDTIKMTFDAEFNGLTEEALVKAEILRQIDKSINNSIGTFHEQVLGGIDGYEVGTLSGFDVKATDNSLFADIKNKHNTMNSSAAEALFQKLARFADTYKKATCYWVQILGKGSFNLRWSGDINGKEYSHSRVYKISGDRFYALLSGEDDAFKQLYQALPIAIKDYMNSVRAEHIESSNSAFDEIKKQTESAKRTILDQITFENYSYYLGFEEF